jgi:hypothetical protein
VIFPSMEAIYSWSNHLVLRKRKEIIQEIRIIVGQVHL